MRVVYSEYTKNNIADIANYTEAKWGIAKRIELIGQIALFLLQIFNVTG